MESGRKERYFQKLAELEDKLEFIQENIGEEKDFLKNRIQRKAIYKEFQELAEVIADISAMAVKDGDRVLEDDYSNIEKTSAILGLEGLLDGLKEANGLRNILVHEYNGIIDKQAYKSIKSLIPSIEEFGEGVKRWTKKK